MGKNSDHALKRRVYMHNLRRVNNHMKQQETPIQETDDLTSAEVKELARLTQKRVKSMVKQSASLTNTGIEHLMQDPERHLRVSIAKESGNLWIKKKTPSIDLPIGDQATFFETVEVGIYCHGKTGMDMNEQIEAVYDYLDITALSLSEFTEYLLTKTQEALKKKK